MQQARIALAAEIAKDALQCSLKSISSFNLYEIEAQCYKTVLHWLKLFVDSRDICDVKVTHTLEPKEMFSTHVIFNVEIVPMHQMHFEFKIEM